MDTRQLLSAKVPRWYSLRYNSGVFSIIASEQIKKATTESLGQPTNWELSLNPNDMIEFKVAEENFCLLLYHLSILDLKLNTESKWQVMHLEMSIRSNPNNIRVNLGLRPFILLPLIEWLDQHHDSDYEECIAKAMKEVWDICSGSSMESTNFRAYLNNPDDLYFIVPGSECDLTPVQFGSFSRAYHLAPHNLDHKAQLYSLLAGIAKLWELSETIF